MNTKEIWDEIKKCGTLFKKLRRKQGLILTNVAYFGMCSVVYISDIRNGRRNPPVSEKIIELERIINASENNTVDLTGFVTIENDKIE